LKGGSVIWRMILGIKGAGSDLEGVGSRIEGVLIGIEEVNQGLKG